MILLTFGNETPKDMKPYRAEKTESGFLVWKNDLANCPFFGGETKGRVKSQMKRWGINLNQVENSEILK